MYGKYPDMIAPVGLHPEDQAHQGETWEPLWRDTW